jgi:hypothetical protein
MLMVSACSANTEDQTNIEMSLEAIEADILIPEKLSTNESYTLQVAVTQGDETVEDANEVVFEVWKGNSREESELIEAEHEGDGVYQIEKTFPEHGVYYVQTHVTARDLHVMPTKPIVVGDVSEAELEQLEQEKSENTDEQGHSGHH